MKTLILPVKRKWFEQIKDGTKTKEYRLDNEYWQKRLIGKTFDRIVITLGYPPKDQTHRRLEFAWTGYDMETVVSEEWNNEPQHVFGIKLTKHKCGNVTFVDYKDGQKIEGGAIDIIDPG